MKPTYSVLSMTAAALPSCWEFDGVDIFTAVSEILCLLERCREELGPANNAVLCSAAEAVRLQDGGETIVAVGLSATGWAGTVLAGTFED